MPHVWTNRSKCCLKRFKIYPLNIATRTFTSTASRHAIGPEDPRFIEIPKLLQANAVPKRDIKGTLPPPREVFTQHTKYQDLQRQIQATAPEPMVERKARDDFVAWKHRLSELRRKNLAEGLKELYVRKRNLDDRRQKISAQKQKERAALLSAPQPEHERLTATTTLAMLGMPRGVIKDPHRENRIAKSMRKVQAMQDRKESERMMALHNMYMTARTFITSEKQLAQVIEHEFLPEGSAWDLGPPETVQEKLSVLTSTSNNMFKSHGAVDNLIRKRMLRISEEVTGGKIDERTPR